MPTVLRLFASRGTELSIKRWTSRFFVEATLSVLWFAVEGAALSEIDLSIEISCAEPTEYGELTLSCCLLCVALLCSAGGAVEALWRRRCTRDDFPQGIA